VIQISQAEIEAFLEEHRNQWFTSKELEKELNLSSGSISSNLRRAGVHGTIQRRMSLKRSNLIEYSITNHEKSMEKKSPDSYMSNKTKFLKENDLEVQG